MNKQIDRDKSQSRQIQLTEAVISDRVDSLVILPTKKISKRTHNLDKEAGRQMDSLK